MYDVGTSFDDSMAKVAAISGANGDELTDLRDKAKEMGAVTKFSASESADAFTYMAMAGWKTEDMLAGIEGIMNLAAASGEDLALTSDIVTDALTAFGLSASDSTHFADVLAAASNNANTNVSMLGSSFKYIAPIAGAMGYSVEDTAVALGIMANSGIKAEQAGTSLRSIMTRLAKPTKDVDGAFAHLGMEASDAITNADGSMKPFSETLQILREQFAGVGEAEAAMLAAQIAGQEAMSGFLAIMNASDEDFANLTAAISSADGTAVNMANTMIDTLPGAVTILKSALEGLGIAVYENGSAQLQGFVEKITEVVGKITEFVSNGGIQTIIDKFIELSPAIAGVTTAIVIFKGALAISSIIDTVTKAFAAFNVVLAANPILAIVSVIAALVVALITAYNTNEDFRNKVNAAWDAIKQGVGKAVEAVAKFFTETIPNAINKMVTFFKELPGKIGNALKSALEKVTSWAKELPEKAKEAASNFLSNVAQFFDELPYKIGYAIGTALGHIIKWSTDMVDKAKEMGKNFLDSVVTFFKELPGKIADFVKNAYTNVTNWVKDMVDKAKEVGKNFIDSVVTFFKELPGKIADFLTQTIDNIKSWVTDMVQRGKDGAKEFFDAIIDGVKELPDKMLDIGKNIVTGIWDGIKNAATWLKDKISDFVGGIVDGVKGVLGINSPSRVFAGIGKNMALGLGEGWEDNIDKIQRTIENGMEFDNEINPAFGGGASRGGGVVVTQNIYAERMTPSEVFAEAKYQQTRAVLFGV